MDAVESRQQEDIQHSLMALETQILRLSRHSSDSAKPADPASQDAQQLRAS
jgi:hypothetical protein